jgi:putrescine transport system substrate-binding protein
MGLAFDAAKIAERLGDTAIDSWHVLFNPELMAKVASCGVQVVDSPAGVFPIALIHLGKPANSDKPEDTDAASQAWETVRPSIGKFGYADVADALADGKVCLALTTSGDAYQAKFKALAAGSTADIRYVVPKEGTVVWYALLGVAKASANTAGAAKLAEYLLRPDVAARLSNSEGFATAVTSAGAGLRAELKDNPVFLPPSAAFATYTPETDPSAAAAALRSRFWQLINTPPPAPAATPTGTP